MSELLVGLVVLPIVGAVLASVSSWVHPRSGWPLAAATLAVQTVLALWVTALVLGRGRLDHAVGRVPPPFGIEFVADGVSTPFVVLVAGVSLALAAYTRVAGPRSGPFYGLYLLLVAGLTGVCVTADVFTLYVFLEISGLAAYALVARAEGGPAALAALQYLLLGTVGATFYLLGVGYAYVATGTLNMADMATQLPHGSPLAVAAFAGIGVGLAVKMALFPLHVWQPDAYEHAPWAVSALLSALVSTVAGYALLRLTYTVFTVGFLAANPLVDDAILLAGCASVVAGGALAYRASSVRRVFAYSSVAQFGLATVGIGLGTVPALVGAIVQLLGHAVMKGGLFVAAGVVAARTGATSVDEYAGVGARTPWAAGSLVVLGLGMVGLPPTVGFVAKWYLAVGAVEAGSWPALTVVVGSTLLSLSYFGRLLQQLSLGDGEERPGTLPVGDGVGGADATGGHGSVSTDGAGDDPAAISLGMRAVAVGAAVATVVLGVGAVAVASFAEPTVVSLLEP
ncbi:proton-conducting transporter transmembrane domain-containing protein [Haloarchaeobius litoreus]|uniref:Proton-conducting transporter membrane subunit n=1 Tax=Haloarchaeobius litoreus TaxID=755306 RepID=A0ABD6DKU3_9EURY|nr:proton-conducting transporter membrane subunit [Haloarchaeobius litoreus]